MTTTRCRVKGYPPANVVKTIHFHRCDHCKKVFSHTPTKGLHTCALCGKSTSTGIIKNPN